MNEPIHITQIVLADPALLAEMRQMQQTIDWLENRLLEAEEALDGIKGAV